MRLGQAPTTYALGAALPPGFGSCLPLRDLEWSNILSLVVPPPSPSPPDSDDLGEPECREGGRYRGRTSQGEKICFNLKRKGKRRSVTVLEFNAEGLYPPDQFPDPRLVMGMELARERRAPLVDHTEGTAMVKRCNALLLARVGRGWTPPTVSPQAR